MSLDQQWVEIERVVQEAFADKAVLVDPPQSPDDWMWLAATVTDHLCAAFSTQLRVR